MNWFPIALFSALSLSTADALSKSELKHTEDIVVAWVREGYAIPFLLIVFFFIEIPPLDSIFFLTLALLVPLEILALFLYVKAIRLSPMSLSIPFMALSPVFIILIAFLLLGEVPSVAGVFGILLIVAGVYALNAGAYSAGILGPFKAILKEKGSLVMIIVAVIYSITGTLGKVAIQHSSPVFFGAFYSIILALAMSVYLIARGRLGMVLSRPASFLPIGLCTAAMALSHFVAISGTQVAYMISVKRTNLIFSVLFGWLFFKESNIRERLVGTIIMAAGVFLIALS
ncbi:MAG: DMT family transporter [Deltaproteobacteria bacterium]